MLARAYEEVDRVLGPDPSVSPTYAQVNQLTYLDQVLKESLRLWPTAPVFALSPYKETMIGGLYRMKKQYQIVVLTPMLHRDPAVWGERAEVFDPDHFSREAERGRPANAYKPFGNGQRACIGRQFALQEAALVLGMVLQRFKLIDHTRYRLKLKETLTVKPDGFRIKVRRRTDRDRARPAARISARSIAAPVVAPRRRVAAAPAARHAAPRALRVEPRHRRGGRPPSGGVGRGGRLRGRRWRRSTSTPDRLPTEGAVVIASASYNGTPPDNAARFCEWLRGADPATVARGRALHGVRLRQPRLGGHLPGDPPADRRAARRARRRAALRPRRGRRARGLRRAVPGLARAALAATLAKALGVELAAAEARRRPAHLTVETVAGRRREPLRGRARRARDAASR